MIDQFYLFKEILEETPVNNFFENLKIVARKYLTF